MKHDRILVFGTFDGLHSGHKFFLRSAKSRGGELIVGVARDAHVQHFKERRPDRIQDRRLKDVSALSYVDEAQLCDEELGSYTIVHKTEPSLIVLGHDQQDLEQDLLRWMSENDHYIPMIRIKKL